MSRHHRQPDFPVALRRLNDLSIAVIWWANGIAHLVISTALVIATLMFIWLFFDDVHSAIASHNLAHGFLHALGTLMILWTVSALVVAEARYLRGQSLSVEVFVEVALVVAVRKLITLPVQEPPPEMLTVGAWTGAVLALALAYGVVRWSRRDVETTDPTDN